MSTNSIRTQARLAHRPAGIIGPLIAGAAGAEMRGDVAEATMFASEAAHIAGALPERRREFATVRACARAALRQVGVADAPILPDDDRVPRWPAGVIGSLTHCRGYRAAAVARADDFAAIGIDAEPHIPLSVETVEMVLRPEERAALGQASRSVHLDRVTFCAKEAVFKAWFPLTRRWLDFPDVSVTLDPLGTFAARVLVRDHRRPEAFAGRWTVAAGFVVASTFIAGGER